MPYSERTFADFTLLREPVIALDLSDIGKDHECPFIMKAFAYPTDTSDQYRNDIYGAIMTLSNRFKEPKMYLEKLVDCAWSELIELTDNTYGTYTTFTSQTNWLGYKLQWHLVNSIHGTGCYRIRMEYKDLFNNPFISYSFRYDLNVYTDELADGTVKFNYVQNGGKIGDICDYERVIDFKDIIWENEYRLEGFYGFETGTNNREFVKYETGAIVPAKDEHIENIPCEIHPIPYWLTRILKINVLQSWELYISDYNSTQPDGAIYNKMRIKPIGDFDPTWTKNTSFAPLRTLEFEPYYQNFERKYC